jgi:lipoprotein signal peptidase
MVGFGGCVPAARATAAVIVKIVITAIIAIIFFVFLIVDFPPFNLRDLFICLSACFLQ